MPNYYGLDPCEDCEGLGFLPDGHSCRECQGSGRDWVRNTVCHRPEPGAVESISVKVAAEVYQTLEWEQEDRIKELDDHPELKAQVESVRAEFARETEGS